MGTLIRRFVLGAFIMSAVPVHAAITYTVTDLGALPGNDTSAATDINNLGVIVGYSSPGTKYTFEQAFVIKNGTIQTVGTLGGTRSDASSVNASGQIVGSSTLNQNTATHGFLYDGTMHDLGTLGGANSFAAAINASGQIVGSGETLGGVFRAFLYSGGVMTSLGTLGGLQSEAGGINDSGQIIGYSETSNGGPHAFLYSGGVMHDLGTLGGDYSIATALNASGTVVGFSLNSSLTAFHSFLYQNGQMTDLGTLGGTSSQASSINALGVIVGNSDTAGGVNHAFVDLNGVMKDLNSLIAPNTGWVLQGASSINDLGQIVGTGTIDLGPGKGVQTHAFLLTPNAVPEPSSLILLGMGAGGLCAFARRRMNHDRH